MTDTATANFIDDLGVQLEELNRWFKYELENKPVVNLAMTYEAHGLSENQCLKLAIVGLCQQLDMHRKKEENMLLRSGMLL